MRDNIELATQSIIKCYRNGGKLLICGNGGSSADCAHICGELLKGFNKRRPITLNFGGYGELGRELNEKLQGSLPAVDLGAMQSVLTATINDCGANLMFAQQVMGLGKAGDVLIGISTSGSSKNVLAAGIVAKELGLVTVAFTGERDSAMSALFDITIKAPSSLTPAIQEIHMQIYHGICARVEEEFWKQ